MTDDVVSAQELARSLGYVSTTMITHLVQDGRMPKPNVYGRKFWWPREQIERWLREPAESLILDSRKRRAWAAFFGPAAAASSGRSATLADAASARGNEPDGRPVAARTTRAND